MHVWLCRLDRPITYAQRATLLTRFLPEDLQRHRRLLRLVDRDAYLLAHSLQNEVLAGYDGIPPMSRLVLKAQHGKPYIASGCNPRDLQFNLSHSGRWGLLAVSTGEVALGVDVEQHRSQRNLAALAKRNLTLDEQRQFNDRGAELEEQGVCAFFDLWSLKESFVKAHGQGISLGLRRFGFELPETGEVPGFNAEPVVEATPERWTFRLLRGLAGHSGALASSAPLKSLKFFVFDPLERRFDALDSLADTTDYQH